MIEFLTDAVARAGERVKQRPAAGGFSVAEHVWHLADLEREGYAVRIARLIAEERPRLPDFEGDRIALERDYQSLDVAEGLAAFAAARRANLAMLEACDESQLAREGSQEGVGPVRLHELPAMIARHDAAHREELEALLGELGV